MNKRICNKVKKRQVCTKPSLQEAFDIVAEYLATVNNLTFFISPDFDGDMNCFRLHDASTFNVVSKPVRNRT